MTTRRFAATAIIAAVLSGVVGCTAAPLDPISSEPATETMEPSAAPVDVPASFRDIADASCDRANREGVTESSDDGEMFLVPVEQAYQDYSAAFNSRNDGIGVIWSTEVFFVCAASIGYQMSADGGAEYPIAVTFDASTGAYRTLLEVQDYGTLDYTYQVEGGVFVAVDWTTPEDTGSTEITYGPPSDEQLTVLRTAVDKFLAEQG